MDSLRHIHISALMHIKYKLFFFSGSKKKDILFSNPIRGGSRTVATSKLEHFMIIFNGWKPLTNIAKSSALNVSAVLDPPLFWVAPSHIFLICVSNLSSLSIITPNFSYKITSPNKTGNYQIRYSDNLSWVNCCECKWRY